jgi:hypothetical protein
MNGTVRLTSRNRVTEGNEGTPDLLAVNHLRQPLKKRCALRHDLLTQLMMRHKIDVLEAIFMGDGDVAPFWHKIEGFCYAEL